MKKKIAEKLAQIVGPENVVGEAKLCAAYFRKATPSVPLTAVCPQNAGQVIELTKLAAAEAVPLFTLKDAQFAAPLPESGGIILDFKKMNAIEKIDKRNLIAHIQRGVTWDQLRPELERNGLKTLLPAAATSPYVVDDMMNRVIMRSAARYPEIQVSNLKVVLADGRVHFTGSHSVNEEGCDNKDDAGPNISRWYVGAEDIYGIPVRASIWLYPVPRQEIFLFFGFDELEPALTAIRNIPRKEACDQAIVMNPHYLNHLVGKEVPDAPPWLVLFECEGHPRLVDFYTKLCRTDTVALGGKELPALNDSLAPALHRLWIRPEHSHGFYTFLNRVEEFHDLVSSRANSHLGELFISHGYGRCAWCEFDHLDADVEGTAGMYEELNDLLMEKGAYFDRPLGKLAEKFYPRNPAYLNQIKKVKNLLDPQRILNPDQLVKGI